MMEPVGRWGRLEVWEYIIDLSGHNEATRRDDWFDRSWLHG